MISCISANLGGSHFEEFVSQFIGDAVVSLDVAQFPLSLRSPFSVEESDRLQVLQQLRRRVDAVSRAYDAATIFGTTKAFLTRRE